MKIDTCYDWNQSLLLIQTDFLPFLDFPQTRKILTSLSENPKHLFFFFLFLLFVCFFFSFPGGARPQAGHWSSSQAGRGRRKIISCAPSPLNLKFYQLLAQYVHIHSISGGTRGRPLSSPFNLTSKFTSSKWMTCAVIASCSPCFGFPKKQWC